MGKIRQRNANLLAFPKQMTGTSTKYLARKSRRLLPVHMSTNFVEMLSLEEVGFSVRISPKKEISCDIKRMETILVSAKVIQAYGSKYRKGFSCANSSSKLCIKLAYKLLGSSWSN